MKIVTKTRFVIVGLVLSLIHYVAAILCFHGSGGIITIGREETVLEKICGYMVSILIAPGYYVWTSWMSKNMPDFVEWSLTVANSLLWGFGAFYIFTKIRNIKHVH